MSVPRFVTLFSRIVILALLAGTGWAARAQSETMGERALKSIVERQKVLLAEVADTRQAGSKLDQDSLRTQLEGLLHEYELLVQQNPDFAAAYASYGYLLSQLDQPKEAMLALLKADHLDPNIALVKNELGNFLAEDGKPLEAADYFRAAIKLAPDEPLYEYQLGTLLYEARDTFIAKGGYTRAEIDRDLQAAFRRAAELAPDRIEFTYRYAQSWADLEHPDWDQAYRAWSALAAEAASPFDRQVYILQEANVRVQQGRFADVRALLAQVSEPRLLPKKQILVAQLPESARK